MHVVLCSLGHSNKTLSENLTVILFNILCVCVDVCMCQSLYLGYVRLFLCLCKADNEY